MSSTAGSSRVDVRGEWLVPQLRLFPLCPEDGDTVKWVYTCDYGKDVGGAYYAGDGA